MHTRLLPWLPVSAEQQSLAIWPPHLADGSQTNP
jgi:hypothetical protein